MFRKMSFYGGMLLCGTAMLAMPSAGWAAHGGGGGGHFGGGAHFGGAHFGGGAFGAAHFGGFRGAFSDGRHFGLPHTGFHAAYGYRGNYPRYGYYGYSPYSYLYSGMYPWSAPDYSSWYDSGGYETPYDAGYQSYYPPDLAIPAAPALPPDNTAHVSVKVPADAEVWFDQTKTHSTGPLRQYQSPPLNPMRVYSYEVRARWSDKGHEMSQKQTVNVTAGEHLNVIFPVPSKNAAQTPAADVK